MGFDYFGTEVNFRGKKLWLFDMDGTIYEEENVFDGTLDLLSLIKKQDIIYFLAIKN